MLVNLGYTASDIKATLGASTEAYNAAKGSKDMAESLRVTEPDDPHALYLCLQRTGGWAIRSLHGVTAQSRRL